MSWRDPKYRSQQLKSFLLAAQTENLKVHVVGDRSTERELAWLLGQKHPSLQSVWEIRLDKVKNRVKKEDLYPKSQMREDTKIPTFFIDPKKRETPKSWIWKAPIKLHNWFLFPEKGIEPEAIGVPQLTDFESLKKEYLKFAISLAEKDLKC